MKWFFHNEQLYMRCCFLLLSVLFSSRSHSAATIPPTLFSTHSFVVIVVFWSLHIFFLLHCAHIYFRLPFCFAPSFLKIAFLSAFCHYNGTRNVRIKSHRAVYRLSLSSLNASLFIVLHLVFVCNLFLHIFFFLSFWFGVFSFIRLVRGLLLSLFSILSVVVVWVCFFLFFLGICCFSFVVCIAPSLAT